MLYLPTFVIVGIVFSPITLLFNQVESAFASYMYTLGVMVISLILDFPISRKFVKYYEEKDKLYLYQFLFFLLSVTILLAIIFLYIFTQGAVALRLE